MPNSLTEEGIFLKDAVNFKIGCIETQYKEFKSLVEGVMINFILSHIQTYNDFSSLQRLIIPEGINKN